jgi:hypothetical protein
MNATVDSFCQKEEGERVRPPLTLKSSISSLGGGGGSSSSSSKMKLSISDWSKALSADAGSTVLFMPMFAPDVASDLVTIVKTLMSYKVKYLRLRSSVFLWDFVRV